MRISFPQLAPPTGSATRRSLAWFNWSMVLRSVFDIVCGGSTVLFVAFALALGVHRESMGRVTLAVTLGCLFQVLALPWVGRAGDRKGVLIRLGAVEPVIFMAAVLVIPWLPLGLRLSGLVLAVFVAAAFLHMTRPLMDDWLASTIPGELRGNYLGRRFQLLSVATILTTLVVGAAGKWVGKTNVWGLAGLLVIGAAFGLLAIVALSRAPIVKPAGVTHLDWSSVPQTLAQRNFRRYCQAVMIYNAPFFVAVPFYQVYYLTVLGMDIGWSVTLSLLYQIVKVPCSPLAGHWVHRVGPRRATFMCGAIYVVFFALLVAATPGRWWPLYLAWGLAGAADAVWAVGITVALYGVVPESGARPAFFAVSNLITLGLYGIGAMFAEGLLRSLTGLHLQVGSFQLEPYHGLYLICALWMIPATFGALLFIGKPAKA